VHGDNSLGFRRHGGLNPRFVKIQRVGANVDKHGDPAPQNEGICGGYEGERGHDDLVSRLDVSQNGGHFQCRGAGLREEGHRACQVLFQPGVALAGERPVAGQLAALYRLADIRHLITGDERLVKGNSISHGFPLLLSSPRQYQRWYQYPRATTRPRCP